MDYTELAIKINREAMEAVSNLLVENGAGGVEIVDPRDVLNQDTKEVFFDLIDEKLVQEKDLDRITVKAYFAEEVDLPPIVASVKEGLQEMSSYLDMGNIEISYNNIPEEKWAEEWKKYYKPLRIGKHICIKPTWEQTEVQPHEMVIEMDPGMAFGTGTHETTSMCVALLEEFVQPSTTVIDIGTGSGILGIIAAKLGAQQVIGVDIDPVAVKVATENALANHVEQVMEVRKGNLTEVVKEKGQLVVSNIIADVIMMLSNSVGEVLEENGTWIASGIIEPRKQEVIAKLTQDHWEVVASTTENDWVALVIKRRM